MLQYRFICEASLKDLQSAICNYEILRWILANHILYGTCGRVDMVNFDNINLKDFKIENIPNSGFYIRDFISEKEEQELLNKVYSAPKPKWVTLKNRRLQNWGGKPTERGMITEPLPSWLKDSIFSKLSQLKIFNDCSKFKLPNHCLINEYESGQGIMPHEDGPFYYPTVATVSLNSYTILDLYKRRIEENFNTEQNETNLMPEFSLLLEPRSLLVLQDDLYKTYLHGIEERKSDNLGQKNIMNLSDDMDRHTDLERDTRVSLTYRVVEKVIKVEIFKKNT
ncbi:alpha-ketoglutarate-dependent dioxygenase alkB homolog 6 isoform X1 [Rhizophagus clarus]|uniref:Alpha-ketoglutarate-dependent dioxygenase alkB homolog 6 isoform X1 n=1 Tax=Rhizophagus clarus TaxID=94130 RepID=A0A8H3LNT4_9GLOM|nr:alpha-ketoglutarate-dependent dioxygenase alkB homolog 6 isoform X1 [Rhizophagus clarus]